MEETKFVSVAEARETLKENLWVRDDETRVAKLAELCGAMPSAIRPAIEKKIVALAEKALSDAVSYIGKAAISEVHDKIHAALASVKMPETAFGLTVVVDFKPDGSVGDVTASKKNTPRKGA